jgi:uncharacterized protein YdeI (YjbR/CyaY-like superfamily)
MATTDPRVDAYVAKSAPFARPVLLHLRAVVHAAVPDVEETIKWGFPHFMKDGIVCSFAAFKAHCAFSLWKGRKVLGEEASGGAMGQFGRIASVADLPPRAELVRIVRQAAALNAPGAKAPRAAAARAPARPRKPRPEAKVPPDLAAALRKDAKARATFEGFPPSARRDYVDWIVEAKAAETRARRLAQAVAWMAEGKRRNWKYERC